MKFLFITNPPAYGTPDNEVTVSYRWAARDPRIALFHLPSAHVTGEDEVRVAPVGPDLTHETFLTLSERATVTMPIDAFDIVFCRSRKPLPSGYLDRLGHWMDRTRFLNNPLSKKEQTSAGFMLKITPPEFLPPMLITADAVEARAFLDAFGVIVAKRPGGTGGVGVYKIWRQGRALMTDHIFEGVRAYETLEDVLAHIQDGPGHVLELVRYLPLVSEGDKRVMVIDGEIRGTFVRRSRSGHWVHNTSSSPVDCIVTDLTEHERRAIAATVPHFQARELRILGYDFLLDDDGLWKISEVNAGNVGGMGRLELITGKPYMTEFLTWMLEFAERRAKAPLIA
ncbi:MAG: hypothetical protein MI824_23660 [Hyphomicrobiales bacterium]|nr:hypothetical protein [Hyphomicrobiales bacterium]